MWSALGVIERHFRQVLVSLQGRLTHKKPPPPLDHHRALGVGLLWGPTGGVFVMSEVPLYTPPQVSSLTSHL